MKLARFRLRHAVGLVFLLGLGACVRDTASGTDAGAVVEDAGRGDGGGVVDGGSDAGLPPSAVELYSRAVRIAQCDLEVRCGHFASREGCLQWFVSGAYALERSKLLLAGLDAGRLAFDAGQAASCLEFLRTTSACAASDWGPCAQVFEPLQNVGAPCFLSEECAPTAYCTPPAEGCPGRCQPRHLDGEVSTSQFDCAPGTTAYGGFCTALVKPNESCTELHDAGYPRLCVEGAFCDQSFTCIKLKGPNEACGGDEECATHQCAAGTCITGRPLNAPCGRTPYDGCQFDSYCRAPTAFAEGVCVPLEGDGGECWATSHCAKPLMCSGADVTAADGGVKGRCIVPTLGAPCSELTCGDLGFCRFDAGSRVGSCVARVGYGAACDPNSISCPADAYCDGHVCQRYFCATP